MSIHSSDSSRQLSRRRFVASGSAALVTLLSSRSASRNADLQAVQAFNTDLGEWQQKLPLIDGTLATLGPRTKLTTRFDRDQRYVYLEGGDSFFNVTKDPSHPFIVETPSAQVKVLGTTFAVSHNANRTLVTTTEGLVAVSRRDYAPKQPINRVKVAANQQVSVDQWSPMKVLDVDPWVELAWTERQIVFVSTWLPTAFEAFNARNRTQIAVPNSVHALSIRLTGRFMLDDPKAFYRYVDRRLKAMASPK